MSDVEQPVDSAELLLFQAKECYVYIIPPRKSTASYRADEWNVNKWSWEGCLKVVSKGEQCNIRLEDANTGELFAQAPVRQDEPSPVEAVIDSSRYFVLRIEDNSADRAKHAFIGIGFRERTQAYDFQAALHDHVRYVCRKKEAEELEKEYLSKPSVDYSLKEGETLRLQLKPQITSLNPAPARNKILADCFATGALKNALPPPPGPGIAVAVRRLSGEDGSFQSAGHEHASNRVLEMSVSGITRDGTARSRADDEDDDDFGDFQTAA